MNTKILGTMCALLLAAFVAPPVLAAEGAKNAEKFPAEWFWTTESKQEERDAMVGKPMPAWKVTEWINGEKKPEDLKGKIIVVDFWATWCGPCIASIPHTNEIAKKYKDQGVEVVAICCTDGAEEMQATATEKKIEYSTAKDVEKKSATAWNVSFWPTFVVVDRDGVVRGIGLKPDYVEEALKIVLAEQPAKAAPAPAAAKKAE